jgi:ElaB/YqjD/DUF883 family membrane-anchored ribosome-binding protein
MPRAPWHNACLGAIEGWQHSTRYQETIMTAITTSPLGSDPSAPTLDEARPGGRERAAAISATVDRIAGGAHEAVDRVAAAANSAAERLSGKGEDLLVAKDHWLQACSVYVKENPFTSLGIAVAVGYLLSRLTR